MLISGGLFYTAFRKDLIKGGMKEQSWYLDYRFHIGLLVVLMGGGIGRTRHVETAGKHLRSRPITPKKIPLNGGLSGTANGFLGKY